MRINFSNVSELTAIPAGSYNAVLTKTTYKEKSNTSGQPFVIFEFTVQDDDERYNGRKVFKNFSLQPQALWALKQAIVVLGGDVDELMNDEGVDIEEFLTGLVGAVATVVVSVKEYQGKDTNQVEAIKEARLF